MTPLTGGDKRLILYVEKRFSKKIQFHNYFMCNVVKMRRFGRNIHENFTFSIRKTPSIICCQCCHVCNSDFTIVERTNFFNIFLAFGSNYYDLPTRLNKKCPSKTVLLFTLCGNLSFIYLLLLLSIRAGIHCKLQSIYYQEIRKIFR